ncbi:MAG: inosine-uridine nucleoside N-ribohydrolase [Arenicella sp.]|jgi:inosine-uridine nucleoside N-ribohydrolase
MQKIILDTDPGIDDAQAIAFAVAHPGLSLLGLTTVFGNADIDTTTNNALLILEKFGCPTVPVAKGAAQPLIQSRMPAPDFVHGKDGLGNLNLGNSSGAALDESAAQFIVRMANQFPGQISLVAVGPLTNIAHAVELDPDLPNKLKELVVMGGTVQQSGNVSPLAEANFINDPHAADIVCGYHWPLRIIGLDVTLDVMLRDSDLAQLRDKAGSTGQFIWDTSRFYVDFYTAHQNIHSEPNPERRCAMHDASAVVYLVERDAFSFVSGAARVVPDGIAAGQLAIDRKANSDGSYALPFWQNRPKVEAAMQVDAERVRAAFLNIIIQHFLI